MKTSRRDFLRTSLAAVGAPALAALLDWHLAAAETAGYVRGVSNDIQWRGAFGRAYQKAIHRLSEDPINNVDFILADVNFNQERRFTNYSGDISGRFIEVASLSSTKDNPQPSALMPVIEKIVSYQNEDGHYGRPVDWSQPVDIAGANDQSLVMPILWGNGRLMLGLIAAYERFGVEAALDSAKKMGDFYVNIVCPRFCDPARMAEYTPEAAGYAAAYVTCVFHGIEGLVRLWRFTGQKKYLDTAIEMADFHEPFDTLPVGHSHGSISTHEALMMLYEDTGDKKWLQRVVSRWEAAYGGGYVNPCGGVSEQYKIRYTTDEGCSEADLLRLNLMLWRDTGQTRYLDMAERLLYNAYLMNQWSTGGFGHRRLAADDDGTFGWLERVAESYWCCTYHGGMGYYEFKECLAVYDKTTDTILYNFPLDFLAPIDGGRWTVDSVLLDAAEGVPVRTRVKLDGNGGDIAFSLRFPDWAEAVSVTSDGRPVHGTVTEGYWKASVRFAPGTVLQIDYHARPLLEDRRFHKLAVPAQLPAKIGQGVLRFGPHILHAVDGDASVIRPLALTADGGVIQIPEGLISVEAMSDQQRDGKHGFVFDLEIQ